MTAVMTAAKTIKLHGWLGEKYAPELKLSGDNMHQIMCGLVHRFGPQFKEDIRLGEWHVCNGKFQDSDALDDKTVNKKLVKKTLHIVPSVRGSGRWVRIIIGVILLVAAYFGYGNSYTVQLGIALILGGVVEVLTRPKTAAPTQPADQRGSAIYNGAVNVTSQGGPVPTGYGRVQRASSVVISTDFSSDEA